MKNILIFFVALLIIQITACTTINQDMAEAKALRFVKERVKFYTKQNDSDIDFPIYNISSVSSYKEKNTWLVFIHITTTAKNETKTTDVNVELDARNGNILTFNNQPVSYQ